METAELFGHESNGMVLAAGDGTGIHLLSPDSGAEPGMRIQ